MRSGAAMRVPVRLVRGGWPTLVERILARFVRDDPAVLVTGRADAATFSRAMALVHVGDTIKITGAGRHAPADALLLDHVDLSGRVLVDLGASDGSTSVELIARTPELARYVIADLYLTITCARVGARLVFRDPSGAAVLVAGRRVVAFPGLSRWVASLYRRVLRAAAAAPTEPVLLLNPDARAVLAADPRVDTAVHDVFEVWPGAAPDVIKVANVLRRLYFDDRDILRALRALHASLADGGHLLVVDNPRIAGIDVRAGLYRRTPDGFEPVAGTVHSAEIDDLVRGLAVKP